MPCQELIVHKVLEFDTPRFFKEIVSETGVQRTTQQQFIPIAVTWVNGVAFVCIPFPDTEEVIAEKLRGRIHYATVLFTKMPYKETYPLEIRRETTAIELEKEEDDPLLLELAEFLKNFKRDQRTNRPRESADQQKPVSGNKKQTPTK